MGAPTVLTGKLPQARATDNCVCVGPPDIIAKLNRASVEALKHPEVAKRLETVACVPMSTTPEQLATRIVDDRAKWKPMVDLYKLKVN